VRSRPSRWKTPSRSGRNILISLLIVLVVAAIVAAVVIAI